MTTPDCENYKKNRKNSLPKEDVQSLLGTAHSVRQPRLFAEKMLRRGCGNKQGNPPGQCAARRITGKGPSFAAFRDGLRCISSQDFLPVTAA
jgi:hypothetical protein